MIPAYNPYDTSIYIKIKHKQDTFYIACDEYDPIAVVKMLLIETMKQHGLVQEPDDPDLAMKPQDIVLCIKNRKLDDEATCHAQQVFNDTVLYLLKKNEKGEVENLDEIAGVHFEYEYPTKTGEPPKVEKKEGAGKGKKGKKKK